MADKIPTPDPSPLRREGDKTVSTNTPNGAADEKPTFDFSRTSYKDMRKVARKQMQIEHCKKRIDAAGPDTEIEPLLDEMGVLIDAQEIGVLQAVASVPRSWLVTGAPESIDWQQSDSLQWLQSHRFIDLVTASLESR